MMSREGRVENLQSWMLIGVLVALVTLVVLAYQIWRGLESVDVRLQVIKGFIWDLRGQLQEINSNITDIPQQTAREIDNLKPPLARDSE
jgi:hypothetical protein